MADKRGMLWLTRSYNNVDKDPECDRFRTIWQKEGITEAQLAVLAGLANSTVKNMMGGKTVRPAHSTLAKMAGAMSYSYGLFREGEKPKYEIEIPKAILQRREYRAAIKAKALGRSIREGRKARKRKNGG